MRVEQYEPVSIYLGSQEDQAVVPCFSRSSTTSGCCSVHSSENSSAPISFTIASAQKPRLVFLRHIRFGSLQSRSVRRALKFGISICPRVDQRLHGTCFGRSTREQSPLLRIYPQVGYTRSHRRWKMLPRLKGRCQSLVP